MAAGQAHLSARPARVAGTGPTGLQQLGFDERRDSYVFVPSSYTPERPMPLVLLLHGAGGHAHDGLRVLLHLAERAGLILLAPASRGATWDLITNRSYGPDRDLADRALALVFERYAVDPAHLAIGGFSDGASYALSLGLTNGDLFTHILAFSPGFVGPTAPRGNPSIFISHGIEDSVLQIDPCSRTIVRQLRAAQYAVLYEEFDGGHVIPPEIAWRAADWFLDRAL